MANRGETISESKQLVIFKLAEEEYGVDILQAKEIEKLEQDITRVPKSPVFVEGVINLRGEIVPIIDLRKRFGLATRPICPDTRVIIVEINDSQIGMIVDQVVEVVRINVSEIMQAPDITKTVDSYFINGVANIGNRLIVLLNLERTLSQDEAKELGDMNL
ncbi:MAG TPA: chemotaxis protein CheW [Bacillota bacterium]|nr:chemotaxis protein CheW [Bacillota bacterium]